MSDAGGDGASSSTVNLTDSKLISFAIGQQKKSRFQKAREEKEAKKKLDEEEAAQVFESFVASFENDATKTFVRGGKTDDDGYRAPGEVYKFSKYGDDQPRDRGDRGGFMNEMKVQYLCFNLWYAFQQIPYSLHLTYEHNQQEKDSDRGIPPRQKQGPGKSGRQIDEIFSEIKSKHDIFSATGVKPFEPMDDTYGMEKGSFDTGDPTTTNLYVGNLAPVTTGEDKLKNRYFIVCFSFLICLIYRFHRGTFVEDLWSLWRDQ
jgi:U2-associated protein SR140